MFTFPLDYSSIRESIVHHIWFTLSDTISFGLLSSRAGLFRLGNTTNVYRIPQNFQNTTRFCKISQDSSSSEYHNIFHHALRFATIPRFAFHVDLTFHRASIVTLSLPLRVALVHNMGNTFMNSITNLVKETICGQFVSKSWSYNTTNLLFQSSILCKPVHSMFTSNISCHFIEVIS